MKFAASLISGRLRGFSAAFASCIRNDYSHPWKNDRAAEHDPPQRAVGEDGRPEADDAQSHRNHVFALPAALVVAQTGSGATNRIDIRLNGFMAHPQRLGAMNQSCDRAYPSTVTREIRNRLVALTLALVVMLPISIIAARWQWSRHLERETMNALIESNSATSIALAQLNRSTWDPSIEYRQITLSGTFDAQAQKLLRKQTLDGEPGFAVLTPFTIEDGSRILVNRGWVAGNGQLPASTALLTPPTGVLSITGRIHALSGELVADPSDLPAGQTNSMALVASSTDYPLVVEQQSPEMANGPTPIPLPEIQAGPHLGYVGQWILIGIASISVYITVLGNLRRELRSNATQNQTAN